MTPKQKALAKKDAAILKLASALHSAALELEEASCTCVDRSTGHQRGCVGVSHAKDYFKLAKKHGILA